MIPELTEDAKVATSVLMERLERVVMRI